MRLIMGMYLKTLSVGDIMNLMGSNVVNSIKYIPYISDILQFVIEGESEMK